MYNFSIPINIFGMNLATLKSNALKFVKRFRQSHRAPTRQLYVARCMVSPDMENSGDRSPATFADT